MILNLLLYGSKTIREIADKLQIQKSAIRIHLESLNKNKQLDHILRSNACRPRTFG